MNVPDDLLYTESHEWIKREGDKVRVGITDHAQAELTDVVFVELPKVDRQVNAREAVAVVESVKAASKTPGRSTRTLYRPLIASCKAKRLGSSVPRSATKRAPWAR